MEVDFSLTPQNTHTHTHTRCGWSIICGLLVKINIYKAMCSKEYIL